MPLKMRPTGLSSGFYKDDVDYSVFCGEWCIGRIYEKHSSPDAGGRRARPYLIELGACCTAERAISNRYITSQAWRSPVLHIQTAS